MISYTLTEADYIEGLRALERALPRHLIWRILLVLVFACFLYVIIQDLRDGDCEDARFLCVIAAVIAAFCLFRHWWRRWAVRRQINKLRALRMERRLEWSPEGIQIQTDMAKAAYLWTDFPKWSETKNLIVLFMGWSNHVPIAKRAFSPDELNAFRDELARHSRQVGKKLTA